MRKQTPAQAVASQFHSLKGLVRNLLVDNPNFHSDNREPAYYFRQYPNTNAYAACPLRDHADFIAERIDEVGSFAQTMVDVVAVDEASDAELIAELQKRGYSVQKHFS